ADNKQSVLIRNQRIRAEQNAFDPTVYGRVRTYTDSEAENRQGREAWTPTQHPYAVMKILAKFFQHPASSYFSALFLKPRQIAEAPLWCFASILGRHSSALEFLNQHIEMELHLFVHVPLDDVSFEQTGDSTPCNF